MSRPGGGCRLTAEEHELRAAYRSRSGADQGGSVGRRVQTTAKPVRRRVDDWVGLASATRSLQSTDWRAEWRWGR
jgi:hypothetical protein